MTARLLAIALSIAVVFAVRPVTAQTADESWLDRLPWRAIGPAVMGGRIDDVAVDESDPSLLYVGTASGGLWKSVNAGTTWQPVFEHEAVSSIGDVALAPTNRDIVWVGTGEPNNRQSSTFGHGVYRSIDGGRTWKHLGLADTHHIGRVIVDPTDPDIAYVAALGHLWGPNPERGVFKTTDGGTTWSKVLFADNDTGAVDMVMDPRNRQVLYAATYQRRRVPWGFNGGGPGGGIRKTTDGGKTWRKLTEGLPSGIIGRIGLDVYRGDPSIVYATVEHKEGGIFRSDDAGATWRKMTSVNPRPMYYSKIRIDPTNDRRIYVLGASFFVSNDGARTFEDPVTGRTGAHASMSPTYDVGVHGDHHTLWINPRNPRHLVLGGDGGLYYTWDQTKTWDKVNNIPIAQIYGIGVDAQRPYNIYAGMQDTHSWGGPSATRYQIGITNADWVQTNFGDGMYAQPDPSDPNVVFTESQDGNITRFNRATGDRRNIKPAPPTGESPYRFNWTSPIHLSPHDSKTVYLGGNRLFVSHDRGDSWTATPDLTRAENRDMLPIMGVLPGADMLSRFDGVSFWGTITTVAESPVTAGVLWVGTDDGNVQVSRDAGESWTNVVEAIPGLGERPGRVSRVEPSRRDAGTAYVSFDRHELDDFSPRLYRTTDFGKTWTALATGLPTLGWINVVKEHPRNSSLLLVGSETGLHASFDAGAHWVKLAGAFPTVPVDDLVIHPRENDLVVGTHGRSIYVLDDVSALEGFTTEAAKADFHLFQPRPAVVTQRWKNESYGGQRQFIGPNPPLGALIDYFIGNEKSDAVKVEIALPSGRTIRELSGPSVRGFNRIVWDLRVEGPEGVANARGPQVLPGPYTVKITSGGRTLQRVLTVEPDPAVVVTDAERLQRFEVLTRLGTHLTTLTTAGNTLRDIDQQLGPLTEQVKANNSATQALNGLQELGKQVAALRQRVGAGGGGDGEEGGGGGGGLRGRINGLIGELDGSGVQQGTLTGLTKTQLARLDQLNGEVATAATDLAKLIASIASVNEQIRAAGVPRLVVPSPPR